MKKIIFLLVLIFALNEGSLAQDNSYTNIIIADPPGLSLDKSFKNIYPTGLSDPKDGNFYMKKSRNMRITGLSLLGAGLLLGGAGLLVVTSDHGTDYLAQDRADETGAVLFICSAATGIASIPLMVMASVYRSKAKLMIGNQKTGFGVPSNVSKNITGLTMTIALGK